MKAKILCLALAIVYIPCVAVPAAGRINYPDFLNMPSNYPAHVQAIHYNNGNVLDALHSVTYGAWTVGFGTQPPVATYAPGPAPVSIAGLTCSNAMSGSSACGIVLSTQGCGQILGPQMMEVTCPASIEFSP